MVPVHHLDPVKQPCGVFIFRTFLFFFFFFFFFSFFFFFFFFFFCSRPHSRDVTGTCTQSRFDGPTLLWYTAN